MDPTPNDKQLECLLEAHVAAAELQTRLQEVPDDQRNRVKKEYALVYNKIRAEVKQAVFDDQYQREFVPKPSATCLRQTSH